MLHIPQVILGAGSTKDHVLTFDFREYKARDFEGVGGPEDKAAQLAADQGGSDDVQSNVRQGGETRRP